MKVAEPEPSFGSEAAVDTTVGGHSGEVAAAGAGSGDRGAAVAAVDTLWSPVVMAVARPGWWRGPLRSASSRLRRAMEEVHHAPYKRPRSANERLQGGQLDGGATLCLTEGARNSARRSGVQERACNTGSDVMPRKAMRWAGPSASSGLAAMPYAEMIASARRSERSMELSSRCREEELIQVASCGVNASLQQAMPHHREQESAHGRSHTQAECVGTDTADRRPGK